MKALLKIIRALLPLLIIGVAAWYGRHLVLNPEKPQKKPRQAPVPVVAITDLALRDVPVTVKVYGTVIPARELTLRPEVRGRVAALHPNLEPGGTLAAGEELLRIEDAEYRIAVKDAEAALTQAEVDLEIEAARQQSAEREFSKLNADRDVPESDRDLAIRKPQLKQVAARQAVAQAALEATQLDLSRTRIAAPFDAVVIRESVEIGQLIDSSTEVARLVGTDDFWVRALVPLSELSRIRSGKNGSRVKVVLETGAEAVIRSGTVLRRLPDLDPDGRMARVLVAVPDPMGLKSTVEVLPLNSYVRVEIEAGTIDRVYVLPRGAIRENDRVWVRDPEGRLQIRDVETVWRRDDDVLVRNGFQPGEQVITSHLANVLPGMPVRVQKPPEREVAREP